jgi:hypothetical protein
MAEALLKSDESTASLSEASLDGEIFEDSRSLSSVPFLNPRARTFKPWNRRRSTVEGGIVAPPPGFSNPPATHLAPGVLGEHVALDCESKFSKPWQYWLSAPSHFSFYVQWSAWVQEGNDLSLLEFRWWTILDDACLTHLSESRKESPIIGTTSRVSRSLTCCRRTPCSLGSAAAE